MKEKVEAIFDLRAAAEEHARASVALEERPTPSRSDALLDARLKLEEATQDAIEACQACDRPHAKSAACEGGVVDFRQRSQRN